MSSRRKPGEGGVTAYETTQGTRYLIVWRVTDPATGKRRQKLQRGFKAETAARKALREVVSKVDAGTYVEPAKQRTRQYLEQWVAGVQVGESTRASYAKNIRLHLVPRLGGTPLAGLTPAQITAVYRDLEREGRADGTGGLSARTVRYCHTILRRALADAVEAGQLSANPADRAKPPTAKAAAAPEMQTWTGEQLAAFLEWCTAGTDDHRHRGRGELAIAWQLLAMTGMRRGEALALRWSDIDFDLHQVSVRRSVGIVHIKGQPEQVIEGRTKTGKARVIDIDERTTAALRAHRATLAGVSLTLARDDAHVLGTLSAEVRHPERFSRRFQRTVAAARRELGAEALPEIRLHDLRHTHATLLLKAGVHPKVVSERLGHANIVITLQTYSHVLPTMQREAADALGSLVYGGAS
jgi:integrase